MTGSIFAGCTEACGWLAALLGVFCFGSYGVPIKSASNVVDVDPFVMQVGWTIGTNDDKISILCQIVATVLLLFSAADSTQLTSTHIN